MPRTFQRQLEQQIRGLVGSGFLQPGNRLPSTRLLGEELGVARRTITQVYEALVAEGLLESRPSSGTLVARPVPGNPDSRLDTPRLAIVGTHWTGKAAAPLAPNLHILPGRQFAYDLRLGRPDGAAFPSRAWRKLVLEHFDTAERTMSDYTDPAGSYALREALCRHLLPGRGIVADPRDVVIVGGTQDGLNLLGRMFQVHNQAVAIENPSYEGAAFAFQALGARLVGIPVDDEGVMADLLPRKGARLLYITPSHQFPLGMSMSEERRRAVVDWAERTGSMIVEDDYDSDVQYDRSIPAVKALAPDWVCYVGSFSKSMGPGLRLGYVVLPAALSRAARAMKAVMSNGQPWLEQTLLEEFIARGLFARHRRNMKVRYAARRDALLEGLAHIAPGSSFGGLNSGMHISWKLPRSLPDAERIRRACAVDSIGIYTLSASPCHLVRPVDNQNRILLCGYASLVPDRIAQAVERIGRILGPPA